MVFAAFVLIALANQDATAHFFGWLRPWLTSTFDWFLVLSIDAITLFGLTTSLGLGAGQVAAGLNEIFGIEPSPTVTVLLIIGITGIALVSVMLGMDAGVKRLSEINMIVAVGLFIFVILATGFFTAIARYFTVMVDYVTLLPALSNPFGRGRQRLFPWLDDLLLGVVDCLVTLCRHVYCPHFPGPDSA